MNYIFTPYSFVLLISAIVSFIIAIICWRRREISGARYLALLSGAVVEWAFASAFEAAATDLDVKIIWGQIAYLGITSGPLFYFLFAVTYSRPERRLRIYQLGILSILPVLTIIMAATNAYHGLLWPEITLDVNTNLAIYGHGPWWWIFVSYVYLLILSGLFFLYRTLFYFSPAFNRQRNVLIVGSIFPLLGNVIYIFDLGPITGLDWTPVLFTLSAAVISWGIFNGRFFDVQPVSYKTIVANLNEGIIILDDEKRIIEINVIAQQMLGVKPEQVIKQPVLQALSILREIEEYFVDDKPQDTQIILEADSTRRYYDVRVSRFFEQSDAVKGWLIILNERTEKVISGEELFKERQRSQTYLDLVGVILVALDANGDVTLLNQKGTEILGYTEADLVGKNWITSCLPEKTREDVRGVFKQLLLGKIESVEDFENPVNTKSGEERMIAWHNTVLRDKAGHINGIISSGEDITERLRAHKELQESKNRYQTILDSQTDILLRFSVEGRITFVNEAYCQFFGKPPKHFLGRDYLENAPSEIRQRLREQIEKLNIDTPILNSENKNINAHGKVHWFFWSNQAIFNDSGEVIEYQAVGRDITERVRSEQVQKTLYQLTQAANQASGLQELYEAIHEIIAQVMPADNLYIALYNEETNLLSAVYHVDQFDSPNVTLAPGKGMTAYVVASQKTLLCDETRYKEMMVRGEIEAIGTPPKIWLGVPLIVENKTIGVITVQDYQDVNAYGELEQRILEYVSTPLASIITRYLAQAQVREYSEAKELLYQAGQQIKEARNIEQLYQSLYTSISRSCDCDTLIASSYDASKKLIEAEIVIHDGEMQDISGLPAIPLATTGEGLQSVVIRTGQPILVNDFGQYLANTQGTDAYYVSDNEEVVVYRARPTDEKVARSVIAVPLKRNRQVVGLVQIMSYRQNAYTNENLHFLEALATQVAISANNAYLYQQAQSEIARRAKAEEELKTMNTELGEGVRQRTVELEERIKVVESLNVGMANLMDDLHAANDRVTRNARKLEAANIELESFSYSVSHDLRAPLRQVDSYIRLLNDRVGEKLDETSQRYFGNVMDATQKMGSLIEDLLALSRTGRIDMRFKPLDSNAIIESVRAQLLDAVDGRELEWTIADLPVVKADPGLIKIVWANLIGNAVKYTRLREKAIIEIGILPEEESPVKGQITFFIRDNGVGFDAEYSEKLFGVFQRLHQRDQFEGTGVGLATVRRIIERHSGQVWAEGVVDQGATFFFSLNTVK